MYSEEEVANRRTKLIADEDNESQWTDEQSVEHDDFEDIIFVDD